MDVVAPWRDRTVQLLVQGYDFLPRLRRSQATGGDVFADVVQTVLLMEPVTCIGGPAAAAVFYDESKFQRHGALPRRIQRTLVGTDSVHTLDDRAHAVRKAMFMSLMSSASLDTLCTDVDRLWTSRWDVHGGGRVVLFDLAADVLTAAGCTWAGVPLAAADVPGTSHDLVAMVDALGAVGPRHRRGRRARDRMEERMVRIVRDAREGAVTARAGSALDVVARHLDVDGRPLPDRVAAVELLNVVRPITAIAWYVAFAARALHLQPQWRAKVAGSGGDLEIFVQEVRRWSPFAPFVGARVRRPFEWAGHRFERGRLVLLDVYGDAHDPRRWRAPDRFEPERFRTSSFGPFDLIPQGGGDPATGHRCPGERLTLGVLSTIVRRLAVTTYGVPDQDLDIPLHRVPAQVRSGVVVLPDRS